MTERFIVIVMIIAILIGMGISLREPIIDLRNSLWCKDNVFVYYDLEGSQIISVDYNSFYNTSDNSCYSEDFTVRNKEIRSYGYGVSYYGS